MAETTFSLLGNTQNVRIDPTDIRGEGKPNYPHLILPVRLSLNPMKRQPNPDQMFVLLSARSTITLIGQQSPFAEAINLIHQKIRYPNAQVVMNASFALDAQRIKSIEEDRKGNLKIHMTLEFHVIPCETLELQKNGKPVAVDVLSPDVETQTTALQFEIPRSHWVDNVLSEMGALSLVSIEIPAVQNLIGPEFSKALVELEHAQKYYYAGDHDKAVAHCRTALEPLKTRLPELKSAIESSSEQAWVKEILNSTSDWLDGLYKKTRELTNKPHHLPSIGHYSRFDAEAIFLVTTAILTYIGRIDVTGREKSTSAKV